MRAHAGDADHLYGQLMRAMAADWEAGGPVREICAGWDDAPRGAVVELRLLGGLFRLVLTGRADELVAFYPCLGGTAAAADAWPAVRPVLAAHREELREALLIAPQTNEVGRSNALLVGLFEAVRAVGLHRVRLLEPGASAGLNLLVDQFRFVNDSWAYGPADSPLVIRDGVAGPVVPVDFEIVERRGCDLSPVDPSSAAGQLRLRSFVWPYQLDRHERLSAALEIAAAQPPAVDRAQAGEWLERQLAAPADHRVLTVVWQSITRMYWPPAELARVDEAVREAAERTPVAHVSMEYPDAELAAPARLEVAIAGLGAVVLGTVADHGIPVTLAPHSS